MTANPSARSLFRVASVRQGSVCRKSTPRDRCGSFTLIELLVVVAVIAILLAILLPALKSAREQAARTRCASRFHQIGVGMTYYTSDYNSWLPKGDWNTRALHDWAEPVGYGLLQEYFPGSKLGLINALEDGSIRIPFHCPQPPSATIEHQNYTTIAYLMRYQISYCLSKLTSEVAVGSGLCGTNPWLGPIYYIANHNKIGGNILYVDGHVKWRSSHDVLARSKAWQGGESCVRQAFNDR